jgi:hypothetical protein
MVRFNWKFGGNNCDNLKMGAKKKPPMPFSHAKL